jgi:hypothetical protein
MRALFQVKFALVFIFTILMLPASGQQLSVPKTTPLVTIVGNVTKTNREPYDEARDVFFKHLGIAFNKAVVFDWEMLTSLEQHTVRTDFPMGGKARSFSGPRLADVLDAAGATGSTATITAIDGYAAELPIADIRKFNLLLAISEDSRPLGIGDYGPAWVIFPRLDNPALKDRNDDGWVWAVVAIAIK